MNVSSYVADFTFKVSQLSLSTLPRILWEYYIEYLWDYKPSSWVARIAYTSRLLAILLILPILVLTLLDIASYVIARTLGVIDDVKASTSDKATFHRNNTPAVLIQEAATPQSDSTFNDSGRETPIDDTRLHTKGKRYAKFAVDTLESLDVSHPHVYFASEENNLKLSGVGVFSPATSQPPSPTLTRRHLHQEGRGHGVAEGDWGSRDEGLAFRRRTKQVAENNDAIAE